VRSGESVIHPAVGELLRARQACGLFSIAARTCRQCIVSTRQLDAVLVLEHVRQPVIDLGRTRAGGCSWEHTRGWSSGSACRCARSLSRPFVMQDAKFSHQDGTPVGQEERKCVMSIHIEPRAADSFLEK